MKEGDAKIIVKIPEDRSIRDLIDRTAQFVAADGDAFEQVLLCVRSCAVLSVCSL